MKIKNNYTKYYRSIGRPDLSRKAFDIATKFRNNGWDAKEAGASQESVTILNYVDIITQDYGFLLIGLSRDARCLNRDLRFFLKSRPSSFAVAAIYLGLYQLYEDLLKAELYEMIPPMENMNKKLFKVIRKCIPDIDPVYFRSPDMECMKEIGLKASKQQSFIT